jgi:hypothetical protein
MTITEASYSLIIHFIKNDSVTNEQFTQLAPKKVPRHESEAAFTHALQEFETRQIVRKLISSNSEGKSIFVWILNKHLENFDQTIVLSGNLSIEISKVVNSFYESVGDKQTTSNPLQITPHDIHILLEIIAILSEQNIENRKELESNNNQIKKI